MQHDTRRLRSLEERLQGIPQTPLVSMRTPIEELPALTQKLGGPRLFIKRDDLTGLAFGGNKVRQMEFFIGDALAAGADSFLAGGSYAQSNHARVAAAAAKVAQLRSVILQRPGSGVVADPDSGNGLLTKMFADDCLLVPELDDVDRTDRLREIEGRAAVFDRIADEYREEGYRPYILLGSSNALGALGYVNATTEIVRQAEEMGVAFSHVVVTSLGATQAGLLVGREAIGADYDVIGMGYQPAADAAPEWIRALAKDASQVLGYDPAEAGWDLSVINDGGFAGPGYGIATDQAARAAEVLVKTEALLLDPVYTAKGFAGLLNWIESGRFGRNDNALFIHTGGLPSLFAYANATPADEGGRSVT